MHPIQFRSGLSILSGTPLRTHDTVHVPPLRHLARHLRRLVSFQTPLAHPRPAPAAFCHFSHWPVPMVYTVWVKKSPLGFLTFSPKRLGIFSPNFTRLVYVLIYARTTFLSNYLQLWRSYVVLSATTQRAFRPMMDIFSMWWCRPAIWHNFVKVANNRIKICSLA